MLEFTSHIHINYADFTLDNSFTICIPVFFYLFLEAVWIIIVILLIFIASLRCSVLVHSGGVHGGHYYAFIRPTLSDQWYRSV